MAFDQVTRNRLSKFVSDTRKLLSDEFSQQMRVKYGLDPATGVVTDIDKLPTMAEGDRQTAQMLRDTLEHYLATAPKRDKKTVATTIDRIVREQAFTVLNRLCAVRMAESRELVIESIAQGTKSKGFQLYARLAGSALGETGEAYICYLFSLFDELSIDLPVLFDRFSPSGRLFPRESVLIDVLGQINHHELQHLWAEDETIGWIYQYFNSEEERRAMRDVKSGGSAAPRNSRELAVRNQFFTPRYVVEFLTDNTLGRIWYEMTQGQTRLVNDCKYLVRQTDEVFLSRMTSKDLEHPSDGAIAMAELLLSGTEETFPEFKADDPQPMIELAHCVSAYATMGDRAHEILGNRTLIVRERSVHEPTEIVDAVDSAPYVFAGQLKTIKTQHILEVLFMICRNDRHGGDGSVYSEPWFVDACNEVRRRVIDSRRDDLSQEDLLRQPVFIPYRPMKDPRDIKMLDPACGSMHFGLYAFDLFLSIYDEAWELEERLDDQAFVRSPERKSLRDFYGTKERYMLDVPRLIIERNIHGIDIDARAVQIAGLSLWLRAQKAWHEAGVKTAARPQITRSNIVCAEPMPGESDLLEQFIADHLSQTSEQQTVASIVRRVFDAMKLAGEAGSLLKIEEEIAGTIAEAKKKWVEGPKALQLPLFAIDAKQKDSGARPLLVAGIDDASFWDEIEERIYESLRTYGEQAEGEYQRRLFVNDTAKGFAFVELCRQRYDIALMNPPFGEAAISTRSYIGKVYPESKDDVYAAFVVRCTQLTPKGILGVISNRTGFFLTGMRRWRESSLFSSRSLSLLADLGDGVLDDALVEAAAYTIGHTNAPCVAFRLLDQDDKSAPLLHATQDLSHGKSSRLTFVNSIDSFSVFPESRVSYWAPTRVREIFHSFEGASANGLDVKFGLSTKDDLRFLRLCWEVDASKIVSAQENANPQHPWMFLAKGGEYSLHYGDIHLVANWADCGNEMAARVIQRYPYLNGDANWVLHTEVPYGRPGVTYTKRTTSGFSPRLLPPGCLISDKGCTIFAVEDRFIPLVLATYSARAFGYLLEFSVASGDSVRSGSAARDYEIGTVASVPVPKIASISSKAGVDAVDIWKRKAQADGVEENSRYFSTPFPLIDAATLQHFADAKRRSNLLDCVTILEKASDAERAVQELYGFDETTRIACESEFGRDITSYSSEIDEEDVKLARRLWRLSMSQLVADVSQELGFARFISKMTFIADRRLELICHRLAAHPRAVVNAICDLPSVKEEKVEMAQSVVSYAVGVIFGRFDIRYATGDRQIATQPAPFEPLAVCSPGMLKCERGLPLSCEAAQQLRKEFSYPIDIARDGILVDDVENDLDIERGVQLALKVIWPDVSDALDHEICETLSVPSLREWLRRPSGFFADHLSRYSKSRRQAPIYWPLSSSSGSFTVWICYQHLSDQTLFTVVNNVVDPKYKQVTEELRLLRSKVNRTNAEESEFELKSNLASELEDFRAELLRIAKFWKPNRNDGVQVSASPLWQFFQLKKWRDTLKKTWQELETGEYDWAHLAFSIWPERVVRSAHKDRSIAIAHELEGLLWHAVEVKKTSKTGRVTTKLDWQPRELSEKELDAIVAKVKSGELGTDNAASAEVANG